MGITWKLRWFKYAIARSKAHGGIKHATAIKTSLSAGNPGLGTGNPIPRVAWVAARYAVLSGAVQCSSQVQTTADVVNIVVRTLW